MRIVVETYFFVWRENIERRAASVDKVEVNKKQDRMFSKVNLNSTKLTKHIRHTLQT